MGCCGRGAGAIQRQQARQRGAPHPPPNRCCAAPSRQRDKLRPAHPCACNCLVPQRRALTALPIPAAGTLPTEAWPGVPPAGSLQGAGEAGLGASPHFQLLRHQLTPLALSHQPRSTGCFTSAGVRVAGSAVNATCGGAQRAHASSGSKVMVAVVSAGPEEAHLVCGRRLGCGRSAAAAAHGAGGCCLHRSLPRAAVGWPHASPSASCRSSPASSLFTSSPSSPSRRLE